LFFWVARMIMLGCHFMLDMPMPDGSERDLKNAVPFREVYIHALVRDADRQKMSKTKGNVIDPIEIVQKYGTDAVRFTLASMASPGTDIAFSEARTEGYRAFANKIWNAARFIFMNVDRAAEAGIKVDLNAPAPASDTLEARWITSRLNSVAGEVNGLLGEYRFDEAARIVYQFFWGDFCDWYLEIVKLRLDFSESADKAATRTALHTLVATFEAALRLLSPFMPFITEELWHAVYDGKSPAKSIALSRYPQASDFQYDGASVGGMNGIITLIINVRARRKDLEIPEKEQVSIQISFDGNSAVGSRTPAINNVYKENQDIIFRLARVSSLECKDFEYFTSTPELGWIQAGGPFFAIVYERTIDVIAERERLQKQLDECDKVIASANRQLSNEAFLKKAPEKVVAGLRKQASDKADLREKTAKALEALG
jgi:valyl-tRNA synthetase